MAHLKYVALLLGAIQQLLIPAANSVKSLNYTSQDCPRTRTIKHNDKEVLSLWCENKKQFKLTIQALPLCCQVNNANTCLEVKITTYLSSGQTVDALEKMCTKCGNASQPCHDFSWKKTECKQSICYKKSTDISAFMLQFPDSSIVTITNRTDNEAGSHLQFYDERKSWIKAFQHCKQNKISLVEIINSTVENGVIDTLENKTNLVNGVWVSLERSIFGTDVEWKWTSGINAEDLNWNIRSPDFLNNHCGKIILDNETEEIQFQDANCHDELPFICQAGPK